MARPVQCTGTVPVVSVERAILAVVAALGLTAFVALGGSFGEAIDGHARGGGGSVTQTALGGGELLVARQAGLAGQVEQAAKAGELIIASNRGPVNFAEKAGKIVTSPAGGGLATGLAPLVKDNPDVTWVAATVAGADLRAAEMGLKVPGYNMRYVTMDPERYALAYNTVANEVLWYVLHGFKGAMDAPRFDASWDKAWNAFRELNQRFAESISDAAPDGSKVLVQDYHLPLVGKMLKDARPDLHTVHFSHTPFAGPDDLLRLPTATTTELLEGMCGFGACGFHTRRWAGRFEQSAFELLGKHGLETFVAPLGIDPANVEGVAKGAEANEWAAEIRRRVGNRKIIGRTDRIEPSKNIVTSFEAFEQMLDVHPEMQGTVSFVASVFPSREGVAEYQAYNRQVQDVALRINAKFGKGDWEPIVLYSHDNSWTRGMAVLRESDAVVINPVRDGMNLVAKETAVVNERNANLILSREAGFFDELKDAGAGEGVLGVNPYDTRETAAAMYKALTMSDSERARRATILRDNVRSRGPWNWFNEQVDAVNKLAN